MKFSLVKSIARLTVFLLGSAVLALPNQAWADCWFQSGSGLNNSLVNLPAVLSVKRNTPSGTVIYDSGWINGGNTNVRCSGSGLVTYGYTSMMRSVAGFAHVYATGVPGVGIKAAYSNSYGSQPANIDDVSPTWGSRYMDWPRSSESYITEGYTPAGLYRVQFIVTGALQSGSFPMSSIPHPTAMTQYGSLLTNQATFNSTTINIAALNCRITTLTNMSVQLSSVKVADFGGVGSTLAVQPFNIGLSCDNSVVVSYQFDGTSPASGAALGLLANSAGANMATGVAVQLMKGDGVNPLPLATVQALGTATTDNFVMNIPLQARYYKTTATVTPGKVSATAFLTMYYK